MVFLNTCASSSCRRAINPPSAAKFQEFVTASKNVCNSSDQNYTSIVLGGPGASAIQGPTTTAPEPSTTPHTSPQGPTAPAPSNTSNTSTHNNNRLKVIAIATSIGAVVGVFLLSLLGFILYRRHQRAKEQRGTDEFFRYEGRSLDLGKRPRLSFVPSRMIAMSPRQRPPVAGTSEWGMPRPFAKVGVSTQRMPGDDRPIGHISLPVRRSAPDPVVKPKSRSRSEEPGKKKNRSSPAQVVLPPRALVIHIPPRASAVPEAPKMLPPRVSPSALALDPTPTADQGPQRSRIPRPAAATPPIITTGVSVALPTSTSISINTSSMATSAPASGKHRPSPSPTTPTSGHTVAGPRSIRATPRPPPIPSRTPGGRHTTSTRVPERIDEKRVVDIRVQRSSRGGKVSDPPPKYPLHGAGVRFVPVETGKAGIAR